MRTPRSLLIAALAAALVFLAGCPGGAPTIPGRGGNKVDPNTCGNYAASDAGRKLKAFLEATAQLDTAVMESEAYLKDTCKVMGEELGVTGLDGGSTQDVCNKVIAELQNSLKVGFKGKADLKVDYKPAVCKVNVEAAASASAECEGNASAEAKVSCEGTCNGACEGTCHGDNSGGNCGGHCDGVCKGECDGYADVKASAQCEAKAEVSANIEAECTEPEVNVEYDASVAVDTARAEAAVKAIKRGLPRMLKIQARVAGPIGAAVKGWVKATEELGKAGRELSQSFGDQALCVSGQIAAALGMVGNIQASVSIQVEVSASASGSVGGG